MSTGHLTLEYRSKRVTLFRGHPVFLFHTCFCFVKCVHQFHISVFGNYSCSYFYIATISTTQRQVITHKICMFANCNEILRVNYHPVRIEFVIWWHSSNYQTFKQQLILSLLLVGLVIQHGIKCHYDWQHCSAHSYRTPPWFSHQLSSVHKM